MVAKTRTVFTINGDPFDIELDDISARESREFRMVLGFSVADALERIAKGDLEAIAALVWLKRRRDQVGLDFDKVAEGITYKSFDSKEVPVSKNGASSTPPA